MPKKYTNNDRREEKAINKVRKSAGVDKGSAIAILKNQGTLKQKKGERELLIKKENPMKKAKSLAKKQGYNDRLDESIGMRRGKESTKKQSYKDRRDESRGMKKAVKAKIGRKK